MLKNNNGRDQQILYQIYTRKDFSRKFSILLFYFKEQLYDPPPQISFNFIPIVHYFIPLSILFLYLFYQFYSFEM